MVEGKIGPHERFESGAGRRRRHALQSDIFEQLLAPGLAFFVELFRGRFESLEDGWIRCRLGVFRRVEPPSQRLSARFEARRGLPAADMRTERASGRHEAP